MSVHSARRPLPPPASPPPHKVEPEDDSEPLWEYSYRIFGIEVPYRMTRTERELVRSGFRELGLPMPDVCRCPETVPRPHRVCKGLMGYSVSQLASLVVGLSTMKLKGPEWMREHHSPSQEASTPPIYVLRPPNGTFEHYLWWHLDYDDHLKTPEQQAVDVNTFYRRLLLGAVESTTAILSAPERIKSLPRRASRALMSLKRATFMPVSTLPPAKKESLSPPTQFSDKPAPHRAATEPLPKTKVDLAPKEPLVAPSQDSPLFARRRTPALVKSTLPSRPALAQAVTSSVVVQGTMTPSRI